MCIISVCDINTPHNIKINNINSKEQELNIYTNELLINLELLNVYYHIKAIESIDNTDIKNRMIKIFASNLLNACKEFISRGGEYSIPSGWDDHFTLVSLFKKKNSLYLRIDNTE